MSSPISDLTERLLLDERDPPVTPKESLYEAPPFDEVRCLNFLNKKFNSKLELLNIPHPVVWYNDMCMFTSYQELFFLLLIFVIHMTAGGHSSSCTCCRANKTGGN